MQRILSGIRPTGTPHLGNYLGSLKQWVDLNQEANSECFFMVADYHALLSFRDTPLNKATLDLIAWELAAGLNPERVTLFSQSLIPAHTELAWILNGLVTVPELGRMTQYKDLVAQGTESANVALFTYPVLQAADILLYRADTVPVGEDQIQHVELTRLLARRFNKRAGSEIFPEPRPRLSATARVMSLHDPSKKMSKSLPQGALFLSEDAETLRKKIARAVTDTGPTQGNLPEELVSYEGTFAPEQRALLFTFMTDGVRNLFLILQDLGDAHTLDALLHNFKHQTLKYSDLKAAVADAVVNFVAPLQAKFQEHRTNETQLKTILADGTERAARVANQTLAEAKAALNLIDIAQ